MLDRSSNCARNEIENLLKHVSADSFKILNDAFASYLRKSRLDYLY